MKPDSQFVHPTYPICKIRGLFSFYCSILLLPSYSFSSRPIRPLTNPAV